MDKNYTGFINVLHAVENKICNEAVDDIHTAENAIHEVKDPVVIHSLQNEINKREHIIEDIKH